MIYSEIADIISGGTPKTSVPEYWNGDIPWLSVVDFNNDDKYVFETEKNITKAGLDNSSTKLLQEKDFIISARGTVGAMAMIPYPMAFNQSCFGIRAKAGVDPDYLFYATQCKIKDLQTKSRIGNIFKSISVSTFDMLEIELPDLPTQKRIAKVLSNIDSKIALNRRINQKLEETARRLYDYWFLQFDFPAPAGSVTSDGQPIPEGAPYRSSGGAMSHNTTLNRPVPQGWEVVCVKDRIEPFERGISYKSSEIADPNGVPMLNLAIFDKKGEYRTGELKFFSGSFKESDKVSNGDMLIACTDLTRNADIIGTPILVNKESDFFVFTMDLAKLTPKNISKYYLYYSLKEKSYRHYIKPFASGTNVLHLKLAGVEEYPLVHPLQSIQDAFDATVKPIKEQQSDLISESIHLTALRDRLLPLLMNGQVTINE